MHNFMLETKIKSLVLINYHYSDNYVFSISIEEIFSLNLLKFYKHPVYHYFRQILKYCYKKLISSKTNIIEVAVPFFS